MKDPRPSFLELLLGRTVEIELPGRPGRRKVSKKWFDAMVAKGGIKPVVTDNELRLVSDAELLVSAAQLGPVGLFVPLLDRFPRLAQAKPEDWDFFLGVASAFAGLAKHEVRQPPPERNRIVRRVVAEQLVKWQPDALAALEDCEGFAVRSMEALLEGEDCEWEDALSKSIGVWVCWNVLRTKPEEADDFELASVVGTLALKIVEGFWEQKVGNA